jgi:hypothetical protein
VDFYTTYYVRGVSLKGRGSPASSGTSWRVGFCLLGEFIICGSRSGGELSDTDPPSASLVTKSSFHSSSVPVFLLFLWRRPLLRLEGSTFHGPTPFLAQ